MDAIDGVCPEVRLEKRIGIFGARSQFLSYLGVAKCAPYFHSDPTNNYASFSLNFVAKKSSMSLPVPAAARKGKSNSERKKKK